MPEMSEEGERVLKAKVSWANGVQAVGKQQLLVTLPIELCAGPAILCSRGGRSARTVSMYIL